jgi:hypothetical protein
MQGAHNPLDLSFVGGEWPQTADSDRLTVDLGDVEPRAKLQQAIEVEEEIALAFELELDSIVGEDARANPLLKLAGQKYNGAKLVGSPNQSKAGDRTSQHRRWYAEPSTCSDANAVQLLLCQAASGGWFLSR